MISRESAVTRANRQGGNETNSLCSKVHKRYFFFKSRKMNFFSSSLPREVVFKIVSYLDQRECVESMMVCHQWHLEMPLYATDLWKEIVISPTSFSKANRCLTRCLGSHTQKLSIYGMESFSVLSRFIHLGCIISSLGGLLHFTTLFLDTKIMSF